MRRLLSRKYLCRPNHQLNGLIQLGTTLTACWALLQGFAWQWWAVAFVFYFYYYCVGMSVGYHRYFSHKQFQTNQLGRWLMIMGGTLGGHASPGAWALTHIKHHKYSDKPGDPHDPNVHGWKMLFINLYPEYEVSPWELRKHFKEKDVLFAHKHHNVLIFAWVLLLFVIHPYLPIFAWAIPYAITSFLSTMMVIVPHLNLPGSYRNFEIEGDNSKNVWWLGLLNWGEGWHNNHHRYPGLSNLRIRWWEIDVGGWVVKLLRTDRRKVRAPSA